MLAIPFCALSFSLSAAASLALAQLLYVAQPIWSLYAYAFAFVVGTAISFALLLNGSAPAPLRKGRAIAACGLGAFLLAACTSGALLLEAQVLGGAIIQILAGASSGIAFACSYLLAEERFEHLRHTCVESKPIVRASSVLAACALQASVLFGPAQAWSIACAAGIGGILVHACGLGSFTTLSSARLNRVHAILLTRMVIGMGCTTVVWGYACHHFLSHLGSGHNALVWAGCTVGSCLWLGIVAIAFVLRGRNGGVFPIVKMYPLGMVLAFVPLDYLPIGGHIFQTLLLLVLGTAMIPLFVAASREISSMGGAPSSIFCATALTVCLCGLLFGAFANELVGDDVSSIIWASAPVVCLVVGFLSCVTVLSRDAFVRTAIDARGGDDAEIEAFLAGTGRLCENCQAIAIACSLTAREFDVLCLLAQGYSTTRIGEMLHIAKGTATIHRSRIYKKIAVHSKDELIDCVRNFNRG